MIPSEYKTTPFKDQNPGTSGLRKKTSVFSQPFYVENFIQSALNALPQWKDQTLVVGGDGRFFLKEALDKIIRLAAAGGIQRLIIGQNGLLSTPAVAHLIQKYGAAGGIILSASHNPSGPDGDFGIKINGPEGGPLRPSLTQRIYEESLKITKVRLFGPETSRDIDISRLGLYRLGGLEIQIISSTKDYGDLMESLFDFQALQGLARSSFRMVTDSLHAVTGPYVEDIFSRRLGFEPQDLLRTKPLEDFGGLHPDPTPARLQELIKRLRQPGVSFGAASDGDGDRNLILAEGGIMVPPGDSLAIIAHYMPLLGFKLKGIARSMPTSVAVDRVAKAHGIPLYITPTGWKFFGALLEAGKIQLCGEESFGTGGAHVQEKDGLWSWLMWLSILNLTKKTTREILFDHWQHYGRDVFVRLDFHGEASLFRSWYETLEAHMEKTENAIFRDIRPFVYTDPVSKEKTKAEGWILRFEKDARIAVRLSGTGTEGATLRLYLQRPVENHDDRRGSALEMTKDLQACVFDSMGIKESLGRKEADETIF